MTNVKDRIRSLLAGSANENGKGLDRDVLNLITTPEYNNLRGNVINHLKRTTANDDAEGKAGRSPEESLNTGRRSQIRFQPRQIHAAMSLNLKKRRTSARKSGAKRLTRMMNKGTHKVGTVRVSGRHGSGVQNNTGDAGSALGEGIGKAFKNRYRKKPAKAYNKDKIKCHNASSNVMHGLLQKSKET